MGVLFFCSPPLFMYTQFSLSALGKKFSHLKERNKKEALSDLVKNSPSHKGKIVKNYVLFLWHCSGDVDIYSTFMKMRY